LDCERHGRRGWCFPWGSLWWCNCHNRANIALNAIHHGTSSPTECFDWLQAWSFVWRRVTGSHGLLGFIAA
jgi:hypothetical protein